ncbi:hypothetical protein EDD11_004451 [Mortierella claussenii]|nr:hypothetical protein EDD11_004451 [Mortierella claussenii]
MAVINAAVGVITIPMKSIVRPEYQNAISITKRYLQKRSLSSTNPLTSVAHDVMYSVSLGIGTPPQLFNLAIDTGSPITWVINKTCSGTQCASIFNRFDCLASSTCKTSPSSGILNASYVSGDGVLGNYVTDIFNLGDLQFPSLAGIVDMYESRLPPTVDGIIGLWYMLRQYKNVPENAPFINVLKSVNALTKPQIGLWLAASNSASMTNAPGGEITFGGVDTTRFTGAISYVDCDPGSPWTIPVGGVSVNGQTISATGALATIDTGTSAMLVPELVSDAINNAIPNSVKMTGSTDGIFWILPCEGNTPVLFTFGNFTVTIPYKTFAMQHIRYKSRDTGHVYCASSAMFPSGHVSNISNWLLGDALIKNAYTVFDFGSSTEIGGRIGFAQLVNDSNDAGQGNDGGNRIGGNGSSSDSGSNSSAGKGSKNSIKRSDGGTTNAALHRASMPLLQVVSGVIGAGIALAML